MNMQEPILFGSVCSGIEAASVAWEDLGWRAAWLAEIEANPSAILKHHYPNVPNLGDMRLIPRLLRSGLIYPPDVFCGGTPCQAFSLAGLRNSLDDARGNLSLTFCEIANEIDIQRAANGLLPATIIWENVPGVLSTKDNAFGHFLAGLAGEDVALVPPGKKWANAGCVYGPQRTVAWRVLDAQYFGLAQRRRRVFVVASARNGFDPAAVLFEFEGVRRDSPPRREAGQDPAGTLASRTDGGGFPGTDEACSGYIQPVAYGYGGNCAETDTARALVAHPGGFRLDFETETFMVQCAPSYAIQAGALRTNPNSGPDGVGVQEHIAYTLEARAEVQAVCVTGEVTHTLKAEGFDASEDGTGRGGGATAEMGDDLGGCLRASGGGGGGDKPHALINMAVRRLTPRECERLQGFPDDYTLVPLPNRRKEVRLDKLQMDYIKYLMRGGVRTFDECMRVMADGPRYKALGNSWAIPVVRWIGRRINAQLRKSA